MAALLLLLLSLVGSYAVQVFDDCTTVCPPAPYKVSVCTMIHNEAHYVEEWLAYHLLVGIEHFYIYDDRSSDNLLQVLDPYIKQGLVTLTPWKHGTVTIDPELVEKQPPFTIHQRFAIGDCLFNHANESDFFGVWDIDEFAVLGAGISSVQEFLSHKSKWWDDFEIPVASFGSSGYKKTPQGLVIENYIKRDSQTIFGYDSKTNRFSGKSIYKSGCGMPSVHFSPKLLPNCKKSNGWVTANGNRTHLPLSINHYGVKSEHQLEEKFKKWHFGLSEAEKKKNLEANNGYEDKGMLKYSSAVRTFMQCMARQRN